MRTRIPNNPPPPDAVRQHLEKVVSSAPFIRAGRMRRFLRYAVEQTLKGEAATLKEYSIALNAYDRSPDFDPRLDPIIRVEASRLRDKLREYYDTDGRTDLIRITLPKKSYRPTFLFAANAQRRAAPKSRTDTEAQSLFLRGRYYWNKRSPKALIQAVECFNAAVQRKPDFALALAGLGDCYASLAWIESLQPGDAWPKALEAAGKALQLNPRLPQAQTTLACGQALYQWNWKEAESGFREALATNERYATTHHWYAMFCLAPQRRLEESLAEMKQACELDPASAAARSHLGRVLHYLRRYDEAIAELHKAIELDPTFHLAYWHLGFVYATSSRLKDARDAFADAITISQNSLTITGMGYIHALAGDSTKARESQLRLRQLQNSEYVSAVDFALIEMALGDSEAVFRSLEQSITERAPRIVHLKVDPAFDPIKNDSRILRLLKTLKLSV